MSGLVLSNRKIGQAITVLVLCLFGCRDPSRSETSENRPQAPVPAVLSIEIVYQSPMLESPVGMASLRDGTLVVADRASLHFLHPAGDSAYVVGRRGEGPGEFLRVVAVGARGDSIYVLDSRGSRITVMDARGTVLNTVLLLANAPRGALPNLGGTDGRVGVSDTHLFFGAGSLVHRDRRGESGILALDRMTGDLRVALTVPDRQWVETRQGVLVHLDPLGPRAVIALSPDGVVAYGDGTSKCISIDRLLEGIDEAAEMCLPGEPIRAGSGAVRPDLIGQPESREELYRDMVHTQEFAAFMPRFDRLFFDRGGYVWAGTLNADFANTHPDLSFTYPDRRVWLRGLPGSGYQSYSLPVRFEPRILLGHELYGFLVLDSGEEVVGRATLRSSSSISAESS